MATKIKRNGLRIKHNKEDDVLYADFGIEEPSYGEDFNDYIVIERGIYSGNFTGLQIINISKHLDEIHKDLNDLKKNLIGIVHETSKEQQRNIKEELKEDRIVEPVMV